MRRVKQSVCVAATAAVIATGALASGPPATAAASAAASVHAADAQATSAKAPIDHTKAVDLAKVTLRDHPSAYGVGRADIGELALSSSSVSSDSGVTHVNLIQQYEGRDVFGAEATVNIAPDGHVLYVGDSLVGKLAKHATGTARLDPVAAVQKAAHGLKLRNPHNLRVKAQTAGPERKTVVSGGGISDTSIPAQLGWQPTANGLRLAWQLTIDDSSSTHLWSATVDAATGALLAKADWTTHDDLDQLTDDLARPTTAKATAAATKRAGVVKTPNPVDDGSSYRVFALPTEGSNDGQRSLVSDPADRLASPYGWHDVDGAPGAESTTTDGNNVSAYFDQDGNNSPDPGYGIDGGAGLTFDAPLDTNEHAQSNRDAALTNLFYWNNVVHDVAYQYGFDEAAGNFETNNYGRGGTGGDAVKAEAADGSGNNNANFSVPAVDGKGQPRMQMYLWPGDQFGEQNQVVVPGVGTYDAGWARFTPAPTSKGLATGALVYAGLGCAASDYPSSLPTGSWTAVIDGSVGDNDCSDPERGQIAQSLGASAAIVAVPDTTEAPVLDGVMTAPAVEIPLVSVDEADGKAIKAAATSGTAAVTIRKNPDHPGIRDGDLDSGVIIHEYTHGISTRLTGGPNINCLAGDEQAGEGWSDFMALALLLDPSVDDPNGPRGMGDYVTYSDGRQGPGIRPAPYSRNMAIQPFTYDSIRPHGWVDGTTLLAPHGIGHGWAAVLYDMTWDLIDKYGFNPDVYGKWDAGGNNRAIQYVIDGLKFQGCNPGLLDSRDAIIAAADNLSGGDDTCTIWATFARRGMGYSAVQGSVARDDNREAFDMPPNCQAGFEGGISAQVPGQGALNQVKAGGVQRLTFDDMGSGLADGSPYSREVDCRTLAVEDPTSENITPRPIPIAADGQLSRIASSNRYTFAWQTDSDWGGTCRDIVFTQKNGVQHRAFFQLTKPGPKFRVTGTVLDFDQKPVSNATVRVKGLAISPALTDAAGRYSFDSVPSGSYTVTATAPGGCSDPLTRDVTVSKPTTQDFSLPRCLIRRLSEAQDGTPGNRDSAAPAISGDGRFVAFHSPASNLVPGDSNGDRDIFVRDGDTGVTERVSVASDGTEGNGTSSEPAISADGKYVAFESLASNLVPDDTNGISAQDVFVHDRSTGATERVSVASDGTQANGQSTRAALSADGRYVAFDSYASNLVAGDTNGTYDVFVRDRVSGTTERVSVASDGAQGNYASYAPSISADGRYIAFYSTSSTLVAGDTNRVADVFVHDRVTGTTERVSLTSTGGEANGSANFPSLSGDGRYVVYSSAASNVVPGDRNAASDIFRYDRQTGSTEQVSVNSDGVEANAQSTAPSLSSDGRYVAFESVASNLGAGDDNGLRDVFVRDLVNGTTELSSASSDGTVGDSVSSAPVLSTDGRYLAFGSYASNLVHGEDLTGLQDVFLRDRDRTQ